MGVATRLRIVNVSDSLIWSVLFEYYHEFMNIRSTILEFGQK